MDKEEFLKGLELRAGKALQVTISGPGGPEEVVGSLQERPCSVVPLDGQVGRDLELIRGDYKSRKDLEGRFKALYSALYRNMLLPDIPTKIGDAFREYVSEFAMGKGLRVKDDAIFFDKISPPHNSISVRLPNSVMGECMKARGYNVFDKTMGKIFNERFLGGFMERLDSLGLEYFRTPLRLSPDGIYLPEDPLNFGPSFAIEHPDGGKYSGVAEVRYKLLQ